MSVTFWVPQAPTVKVAPFEDEPDFFVDEPVAPFSELNLSNSNAAAILAVVAPHLDFSDGDLCGRWEGDELDRVISATTKALNKRSMVSSLVVPDSQEGRIVTFGRTQEYVERRLSDLLDLLVAARRHNYYVSFG